MKKLVIDIETRPSLAYVWGLWKQDINIKSIVEHQDVLCWAAKWHGEDEVFFRSSFHDQTAMVLDAWELLEEADAVVHYNGKSFDIPRLNSLFLDAEYVPPAPYHQIDLLDTVKRKFGYASNKLDYVSQRLGIGGKADTGGMETWIGCMNNDPEAWDRMKKYNIQDVLLTERLYDRLLPWIDGHPSYAAQNGEDVCPNCGSDVLVRQGMAFLKTGAYQRYVCVNCGKWLRGTKRIDGTKVTEASR